MNNPLDATSSLPAAITSPLVVGQWNAFVMNDLNDPCRRAYIQQVESALFDQKQFFRSTWDETTVDKSWDERRIAKLRMAEESFLHS